MRTTSLARIHEKMGTIVRMQLRRNFAEFMFARMERFAERIYEMERLQCIHCEALHFLSPRFEPVDRHFGTWRAFLMVLEQRSTSEDVWQR